MRIKSLILFVFSFTLFLFSLDAGSATRAVQDTAILETVKKYLEAKDTSEKEAALKQIDAIPLKAEQVPELAKSIHALLMKGPTHTSGSKAASITYKEVDGKEYDTKYYATFSGDKDGGRKYPLFVILHSGGGKKDHSGEAARELTWWPKQKDAIAVAPVCRTDFSANVHWNSRPNFNLSVAVIEEMCRSYPVDTNRVYVLGCSMGGWGAWSHGSLHADRFTAAVAHSSGTWLKPNPFPLENLMHVPVYIHHGGNENPPWETQPGPKPAIDQIEKWRSEYGGGYELEVVNKEGQGHCKSSGRERSAMMDWLLSKKRNPYPKKIVWKLTDASSPWFYWLKVQKAKKNPAITAEFKDNSVEIKAPGVKAALTVYVNSALADMSKPVTVVVDGEQKFSGVVKPSLAALVESLEAKKDLEMYFWGKVSIN